MRELTLRVPVAEMEDVLDALLPALPGGIHIREDGEVAELRIADFPGTPPGRELCWLAGPAVVDSQEAEVSDDWRERRLDRYEPLVVADRFLLRPKWAPPGEDPDLTEIVLAESVAFGSGAHPTTQACLALLAAAEPVGSFVDLGCGSGVLAIAAAKLGFEPVVAVDRDEDSVAATRKNAAHNRVEVDARRLDLAVSIPPQAETAAANVPPQVHLALAPRLGALPSLLIASGFERADRDAVTAAWRERGLRVDRVRRAEEWLALEMRP